MMGFTRGNNLLRDWGTRERPGNPGFSSGCCHLITAGQKVTLIRCLGSPPGFTTSLTPQMQHSPHRAFFFPLPISAQESPRLPSYSQPGSGKQTHRHSGRLCEAGRWGPSSGTLGGMMGVYRVHSLCSSSLS